MRKSLILRHSRLRNHHLAIILFRADLVSSAFAFLAIFVLAAMPRAYLTAPCHVMFERIDDVGTMLTRGKGGHVCTVKWINVA